MIRSLKAQNNFLKPPQPFSSSTSPTYFQPWYQLRNGEKSHIHMSMVEVLKVGMKILSKKIKLIFQLWQASCVDPNQRIRFSLTVMLRSNRSYVALVLIFFVMDIYVSVNSTESGEIYSNSSTIAKSRMKRYLIFQPGTRIFVRKFINW